MNKGRKKSNALIIIGAILVLALAVGLLASMSGGFKNWDTKTWFGKTEPTEEVKEPEVQTYKIDLSFRPTEDEPYTAYLDFREAFDVSVTGDLDVTFNGKDLKLKRFVYIADGIFMTGWSDSGNTECNVAVVAGYMEDGLPTCYAMAMEKSELVIRTTYDIKVILQGTEADKNNDKESGEEDNAETENNENTEVVE